MTDDASAGGGTDAAPDAPGGSRLPVSRRTLLKLGAVGAAGAGAGAYALSESGSEPVDAEPVEGDRARTLAAAYAPVLHFERRERWFPTDPRPYATDRDGERVVDGFAALDGYTRAFAEAGAPPAPTVFYRVLEYPDDPLAVVQYWAYSVFDQFATNFHWHDWELLQVFVDTDRGTPVLFCASAHSRKVPNNEYLDPERTRAAVISEVGSHSSALGVNATSQRFERLPVGDLPPDITNRALEVADVVEAIPAAYGLPRDEGMRLPYAVPELDGAPVYEHERLPNVDASDLLSDDLTVRSFAELAAPPTDLPTREHGTTWRHADDDGGADRRYDLVPTAAVEDVDALTGPQLSFEFPVPKFAEDAVASHLTTAGLPWTQERYTRPTADVTDPSHRAALADRYPSLGRGGPTSRVVGALREATPDEDAPDGLGVTTAPPGVEGFCLLESEDPTAVPTWSNVVAFRDVADGEHRLTVNGPGYAPYAERFGVGGGDDASGGETDSGTTDGEDDGADGGDTLRVGVEGSVTLASRADATKVRGDPGETALSRVAVADDFGGPLYDSRPDEDGRFALYVHRGGAYTVEVRDDEGLPGAARVNPRPEQGRATVEDVRTGKASVAGFVADLLDETLGQTEAAAETGEVPAHPDRSSGGTADQGTTDEGTATPDGTRTDTRTTGSGDGTPTAGGGRTTTGGGTTDGTTDGTGGVLTGLRNALAAATRAAEAAEAGNPRAADERLRAVRRRLDGLETALDANAARLPDEAVVLLRRRLELLDERVEQALETPLG
ncbi:MAG: hypothetical protein ABEH47_04020 [Haloferacaceae archaeon]